MLDQLDEIQKQLNKTLDDTKKDWSDYKKHSKQLQELENQNENLEMGGIKIKELNNSLGTITKFLDGAFKEVNESVNNINFDIDKTKKENNKE